MDEKIRQHLTNYLKGLNRERASIRDQLKALEAEMASVAEILKKGDSNEPSN